MKLLSVVLVFLIIASCKSNNNETAVLKQDSVTSKKDTVTGTKSFTDFAVDSIFTASGTEPFWSLKIDSINQMIFKTADGYELNTLPALISKIEDADLIRYSAITEKGSLIVQIQRKQCINEMSGEKFDYSVTIDTKYKTELTNSNYKGCGTFF